MDATRTLSSEVGIKPACDALAVPRSGFYRAQARKHAPPVEPKKRPSPARALSTDERQGVLNLLHADRFADQAPHEVYATLLDEGVYHCSIRTMYRILNDHTEVKERRNQLCHPVYQKPELLATAPNQVWSWDITKLLGPVTWSYFYLYVILDIFSRYVVGWMIAPAESAVLAETLIRETCDKQSIEKGRLTLHADRGSSMTSKPVALLLSDLGVTKTHSRPHTSDDNPYSESQFKTLKYRPDFPERFGCIEDARSVCQDFFCWYNTAHRHTGIGIPVSVCSRPRPCTMAWRTRSARPAPRCSRPPMRPIRSGLSERCRFLRRFRRPRGSTSRYWSHRAMRRDTKCGHTVSQNH
jgi:putative transposase